MTSAQLFALNRKNSILRRLKDGEKRRSIADRERVCMQYVSKIAKQHGIVARAYVPRSKAPTAAQVNWGRISRELDQWNARNGRA